MGDPRRAPQAPRAPRPSKAVPLRDCRCDDRLRCTTRTDGRTRPTPTSSRSSPPRSAGDATRRTRYALHLPYTIVEHIDWGGADDQRVVESQRPDRVPVDLTAELHLSFDAVAVAYRRAMRAQGFG
jgi:hypothetical protein